MAVNEVFRPPGGSGSLDPRKCQRSSGSLVASIAAGAPIEKTFVLTGCLGLLGPWRVMVKGIFQPTWGLEGEG